MQRLAEAMVSLRIEPGSLAIFWLGQAGFAFKTSRGQLIFIDAYLSNTCETLPNGGIGSRRLIPTPLEASEVTSGLMVGTHEHQDHFDDDSLVFIARNAPAVRFAGSVSCLRSLKRLGIPLERATLLEAGHVQAFDGFTLRAVFADHGASEPEAIGLVLEVDGLKVYHTGDTSYRPEMMGEVMALKPDIIIPCINGTFGNLNALEAARLAADVGARVAIPCHFWMFIGQNLLAEGMPAAFLEACKRLAPHVTPVLPMIAAPTIYTRS
jgi:L-ascorbate 6-phosphate lactonase